MAIRHLIIQTCNGCGQERNLDKDDSEELGGWRKLGMNRHICGVCIIRIDKMPFRN